MRVREDPPAHALERPLRASELVAASVSRGNDHCNGHHWSLSRAMVSGAAWVATAALTLNALEQPASMMFATMLGSGKSTLAAARVTAGCAADRWARDPGGRRLALRGDACHPRSTARPLDRSTARPEGSLTIRIRGSRRVASRLRARVTLAVGRHLI